MAFLGILMILSVVGIGAVFALLKSDGNDDQDAVAPDNEPITSQTPEETTPKPKKISKFAFLKKESTQAADPGSKLKIILASLSGALSKIKFGKNKSDEDDSGPTHMPNLKEYLDTEKNRTDGSIEEDSVTPDDQLPSGTAGIMTAPVEEPIAEATLSKEEEEKIEKEIEWLAELNGLKEKYAKLESLFNEKSSEYEKTKESLDHELQNRKEFNKVKDLLEKEVRDSKDKTRSIQGELNNTQTENENQKKRTAQLEEKAGKLEKELLEKEDKIEDLVKRMQAFASPSTAAIPPVMEEKAQETSAGEPSGTDQTPLDQPPENQPQADPSAENIQTGTNPPADGPAQNEVAPNENVPAQSPVVTDGETPSQNMEDPKEPEAIKKIEEGESPGRKPSAEGPTQAGDLKSNLSANTDQKPPENQEKEEFLKLRPDVLSGEPKEMDSKKPPDVRPQEKPPEDQKTNP